MGLPLMKSPEEVNALEVLLPNKPSLEMIQALEHVLRGCPDQVEIEPIHHFSPGVYAREIEIPAGVVIVGKLHKTQHLIMLLSGEVTIYTDEGMKRMTAPQVWQTYPGTKRAIYAHETSRLMTIHPTNETDLEVIETQLIEPEPVPLLEGEVL